jgi:predicted RNase H-like HicB family nuclease
MRVVAIVHEAEEGGFWAEVPALPGCYTQGETLEELKANLREAVELMLESSPEELKLAGGGQLLELAM